MKALTVLLVLCVVVAISHAAILSIEEGSGDDKRTFRWTLDPLEEPIALPIFGLQEGEDGNFTTYHFLGTLDCSNYTDDEVIFAIYDISVDTWVCRANDDLPDDPDTSSIVSGLAPNCTLNGAAAIWTGPTQSWECSEKHAFLSQASPESQPSCADGDILLFSEVDNDFGNGLSYGVCFPAVDVQVGPDAINDFKRNTGDPDEAFFYQFASRAIGNLASAIGNQADWNFWQWTPLRTGVALSSLAHTPPMMPSYGNVAVLSASGWDNAMSPADLPTGLTFHVVVVQSAGSTFTATQLGDAMTIGGENPFFRTARDQADWATTPLGAGDMVSIEFTADGGLSGADRDLYMSVGIWISVIQVE